MLRISQVTRRFGAKVAVDAVTLEIPEGQMVGIIGRSGAGKSTLLRMINRLTDPSAGSISFSEVEVSALKGRALRGWQRDCAMIFQQFNLVPRLDVITNVMLSADRKSLQVDLDAGDDFQVRGNAGKESFCQLCHTAIAVADGGCCRHPQP